ncbi:MAG TPA: TraM recognition domain-containing protein, partial [Pyrinomonadaceae bacterium]|nr:TraM recognition domain-containing protein [Pyrinomonadaceae bacterium]
VALDTLREKAKTGTNVLVALDEAGNVPLSKLPEGINTDRAVGICYFLGYQDKNQPITQYGREAANSFLGTAGVNIFLPGVDDDTADMASKRIGETTILQRSSSDAKNNGFDQEKLSEAGRKLILPQDLTEMVWFTQCVITIKGAAPIRTKIPNDAKQQDTRISRPQRVIGDVSEEVLRLLEIIKGRENEGFIDVSKKSAVVDLPVRDADKPQPVFVPEKIYFPDNNLSPEEAGNTPETAEAENAAGGHAEDQTTSDRDTPADEKSEKAAAPPASAVVDACTPVSASDRELYISETPENTGKTQLVEPVTAPAPAPAKTVEPPISEESKNNEFSKNKRTKK